MGTSSSQRSPATPEWERVRELYRQPNPDPGEIAARIVEALDPATRQGLSDRGVTVCLDTGLLVTKRAAQGKLSEYLRNAGLQPHEAVPLQIAAAVRSEAQDRIISDRAASRFAELALDGLAVAVMDAACGGRPAGLMTVNFGLATENLSSFYRDERLHEFSRTFLSYDFDRVFRYFVSRDLSDFVGSSSFPDVGYAHRLLDRVAQYCRECTKRIPLENAEPILRSAIDSTDPSRIATLQDFLRGAIDQGLAAIATGGAV